MSKFSIYRYRFFDIRQDEPRELELFDDEQLKAVPDGWKNRVSILSSLFNEQKRKLEFMEKDIVYPHKLIDCPHNSNVAIMQFANVKEIMLERNFKKMQMKYNPSCWVFIDNRQGIRHIAIQRSRDSFYSTDMVARILEGSLNKLLMSRGIAIEIKAQRYPKEFWTVYNMNKHRVCGATFSLSEQSFNRHKAEEPKQDSIEDVPQSTTDFLIELEEFFRETGGEPSIELKAQKGCLLHLREDSPRVKRYVQACADAGQPIKFRTVDGLEFCCFVDKGLDEEDKIMEQEFDDRYLPQLGIDDLFNTPTQKVIEFLNSIKINRKNDEDPDDEKIA